MSVVIRHGTWTAAFAQSRAEGSATADRSALATMVVTATRDCLGIGVQICANGADDPACFAGLSIRRREERAAIAARRPPDIGELTAVARTPCGGIRARTSGAADAVDCDRPGAATRDGYCEIVSGAKALTAACDAWRMARRAGAVEPVGHAPVDLELIR